MELHEIAIELGRITPLTVVDVRCTNDECKNAEAMEDREQGVPGWLKVDAGERIGPFGDPYGANLSAVILNPLSLGFRRGAYLISMEAARLPFKCSECASPMLIATEPYVHDEEKADDGQLCTS